MDAKTGGGKRAEQRDRYATSERLPTKYSCIYTGQNMLVLPGETWQTSFLSDQSLPQQPENGREVPPDARRGGHASFARYSCQKCII